MFIQWISEPGVSAHIPVLQKCVRYAQCVFAARLHQELSSASPCRTITPFYTPASFPTCALKSAKIILDLLSFTLRRVSLISSTYSDYSAFEFEPYTQGCDEDRQRLGQEASLAPPCSNLRSFGKKFTVLKKVLMKLLGLFVAPSRHLASPAVIRCPHNHPGPGELSPLAPRRYAPAYTSTKYSDRALNMHTHWDAFINAISQLRSYKQPRFGLVKLCWLYPRVEEFLPIAHLQCYDYHAYSKKCQQATMSSEYGSASSTRPYSFPVVSEVMFQFPIISLVHVKIAMCTWSSSLPE